MAINIKTNKLGTIKLINIYLAGKYPVCAVAVAT